MLRYPGFFQSRITQHILYVIMPVPGKPKTKFCRIARQFLFSAYTISNAIRIIS